MDEEEDIPTTIAMRDDAQQAVVDRARAAAPQRHDPRGGAGPAPKAPSVGAAPTFGAPPSSQGHLGGTPSFGLPPAIPQAPSHGMPAGPQGGSQHQQHQGGTLQMAAQSMGGPNRPQAAIETVMSMPRPDAATLWLAKQDVTRRAGRQSLAVLVALSVMTAVCVAGLATLLYLKLVAAPAIAAEAEPPAAPSGSAAAMVAPSPGTAQARASSPTGSVVSARPPPTAAPVGAPIVATPGVAASTAPTSATGEEPGYLTIICKPFCDDVRRGAESLGPSPIVKAPVPPGQHRIVLTRSGSPDKVISVLILAGEVHKEQVTMK